MSYAAELEANVRPVAEADVATRAEFIARTYTHLLGAVGAFTALEVFFFTSGIAQSIIGGMGRVGWLPLLGAFVLVSWIANSVAAKSTSRAAQYAALAAYVVIEAVIFVPLLFIANMKAPGVLASAVAVTALGFTGLSAIVFTTRKDFSFLGGLLRFIGFAVLATIVGAVIFNFTLGTWFTIGMIVFAGGAILYDTSNVLHHYPEDRYVSASLSLFASVMLLFWYVLRLFLSRRD